MTKSDFLAAHARRWGYRALAFAALFGIGVAHRLITYGPDRPFLHVLVPFVVLGVVGATLASSGVYLPRVLGGGDSSRIRALRSIPFRHPDAVVGSLVGLFALTFILVAPACGCTTRQSAYLNAVKSDLRNLHSVQELHRHDTGRYALSRGELRLGPSPGVMMVFRVQPEGWTARATHVGLPEDVSCVVHEGTVDRPFVTLSEGHMPEAGTILCEGNIYH